MLIPPQGLTVLRAQPAALLTALGGSDGLSADQFILFADQLMQEGEYFRAITEYRRFLFYYPHDARRALAHFRIGLAFYRGQSYGEALTTFQEVTRQYPETPYGKQAWLWQGESLMRQSHYAAAEQIYTAIMRRFPGEEIGAAAQYQRGWTLLYRRQWQEAASQFQNIPPESALHGTAQRLTREALDGEKLPYKSPVVAGILSGILPGSGQWYNGRAGDALLAIVLNGLFIAGIVEAIQHQERAIAGVLSFVEAGWYVGTLYGAVNGAQKHNRHMQEGFLRNLGNRYRFEAPEGLHSHSVGIRFSFRF